MHKSHKKNAPPTKKLVYGKPVPTKFLKEDEDFLNQAAHDTDMSRSKLVRLAVRLMRRQKETFRSYGFLLDLAA